MIGGIIERDTIYPRIHRKILRSTHMAWRTPGPSLIKVGDVVTKKAQWMGCVFGCGDNNGEMSAVSHIVMHTKTLIY